MSRTAASSPTRGPTTTRGSLTGCAANSDESATARSFPTGRNDIAGRVYPAPRARISSGGPQPLRLARDLLQATGRLAEGLLHRRRRLAGGVLHALHRTRHGIDTGPPHAQRATTVLHRFADGALVPAERIADGVRPQGEPPPAHRLH